MSRLAHSHQPTMDAIDRLAALQSDHEAMLTSKLNDVRRVMSECEKYQDNIDASHLHVLGEIQQWTKWLALQAVKNEAKMQKDKAA